jgi:predicted transcriptional regulator of viral defense system
MYLKRLVQTRQTVFSVAELQQLFDHENKNYTRLVIHRMMERGELQRVYHGIYAYRGDFNRWELANKVKAPSYVSLETILVAKSVVFQHYGNIIFSISDNTVTKQGKKYGYDYEFQYRTVQPTILSNPAGLEFGQVVKASLERAICDRIYLTPNYYFDNLGPANKNKLLKLAQIYNQRVYQEVEDLC